MSSRHSEPGGGRVIVVPRPLAGFFYERLVRQYGGRPDVTVLVDRRRGERRRSQKAGPAVERRSGERRTNDVYWSLAEMPCRGAPSTEVPGRTPVAAEPVTAV